MKLETLSLTTDFWGLGYAKLRRFSRSIFILLLCTVLCAAVVTEMKNCHRFYVRGSTTGFSRKLT